MSPTCSIRRRQMLVRLTTGLLALFFAHPLLAAPLLSMPPGTEPTARIVNDNASHALPIGPWRDGKVQTLALIGAVENQSWRLPGLGKDTLGLMQKLTQQLATQGYKAFFSCETDTCGGFDFRYETKVLSEPEMHVDLGDFRFLSAIRGVGDNADYVGLLVSRAGDTGFVQLSQISPQGTVFLPPVPSPTVAHADPSVQPDIAPISPDSAPSQTATSLAGALETMGSVVLDDLVFDSGATDLDAGEYASLGQLAAYLRSHPERRVIIVGHTDASGSLDVNISVSRKRAQAVMSRLISEFGVASEQISAEGVGFLGPRASNLTEMGRHKNRRVEAILASTR
jgi:OOP family OmpA-OmpF porin